MTDKNIIEPSRPPSWADGQDEYGYYANFIFEGVTQVMRWIEPGTFLMGSSIGEVGRKDNETQHEVTLTKGFWLADTACTQELWEKVMDYKPSIIRDPQLPVIIVSWDDCQRFFKQVKALTGLELRLPTEAQWEYACRAGTETPFFFGDNITTEQVNFDGRYSYAKYANGMKDQSRWHTAEVKAFPCNAWGLYQMHGNVQEWCEDCYGEYPKGSVVNPKNHNYEKRRVCRGGCWSDSSMFVRSASRNYECPFLALGNVGFRFCIR